MPSITSEASTSTGSSLSALTSEQIRTAVEEELQRTPFIDIHTHLFMPSLGKLGLWGIDELVTYHYLEAELFRFSKTTPAEYWKLSKQGQADLIWQTLFVQNRPISESTRGVVAVLSAFGLDPLAKDLTEAREFFGKQEITSHIRRVFELAGISEAVMTNDPLDPEEAGLWERGAAPERSVPRCPPPRPNPEQVAGALAGASGKGLQSRRATWRRVDEGSTTVPI